jgi:D-alanine-D-alanine ligase
LRDQFTILIIRRRAKVWHRSCRPRTKANRNTHDKSAGVWMPRIGFAYNQKPEPSSVARPDDEAPRGDEEPPSTRRDAVASRNSDAPALTELTHSVSVGGSFADSAHLANASADDEFAEWDSIETIDAVANALAALGDVIRLEANADFPHNLRHARPDIVFNIAEGLRGVNREAHVPAICEFFQIPYSASDPFTLSLCLDKAKTKEVLAYHGVPTARFSVIDGRRNGNERRARSSVASRPSPVARFPVFVKPIHEGSSKGITEANYCASEEQLHDQVEFLLDRYKQPVLIEEYLPGAEFTCAVLGNGDEARVLPIVGMNFEALPSGALPVYGFEAKWIWDRPEQPLEIFECPARITEELRSTIEDVVLRAYRVLGCRDWSRIDVRLDASGKPNVVEVNPLPGILPNPADNSCFPKAARAAGMSYDELIQACLIHAAERQGIELGVATTIGATNR